MSNDIQTIKSAVSIIKTAILKSQARAAQSVNREQLALYYGIGRYISLNSRGEKWGRVPLRNLVPVSSLSCQGFEAFLKRA